MCVWQVECVWRVGLFGCSAFGERQRRSRGHLTWTLNFNSRGVRHPHPKNTTINTPKTRCFCCRDTCLVPRAPTSKAIAKSGSAHKHLYMHAHNHTLTRTPSLLHTHTHTQLHTHTHTHHALTTHPTILSSRMSLT